jgi:rubrerythrin
MEGFMDILESAIAFEKEGEAFYWELADKTDNRGIKNICLMLARDEAGHIKAIENLIAKQTAGKSDSTIIVDVKALFGRFINGIFDPEEPLAEESMFRKAMDLEKKTMDFYTGCSEEAQVPSEKALFLQLAGEESKHYTILGNILEFRKNSKDWIRKRTFDKLGK